MPRNSGTEPDAEPLTHTVTPYGEARVNNDAPCNVGVRWWNSLRYHYSPYIVLAGNHIDVNVLC
jgi:hypothetical protein